MTYKTELNGVLITLELDCSYFHKPAEVDVGFEGEEGIVVAITRLTIEAPCDDNRLEWPHESEGARILKDEYAEIWAQWKMENE